MARRKKDALSLWAVLLAGFIAGVAVVLLLVKFSGLFVPVRPARPKVATLPPPPPPEVAGPIAPGAPPAVGKPYPRVAIVIDDMGQDMARLKDLVALNAPITVAVLPNLIHSKQTATEAHQRGLEVLLHLPMEPRETGSNNPGKGALLVDMGPDEIKRKMEEDLKTVPFATGINNHMGSRFTEDEGRMRTVLGVVKKKKMYFLDSRTSPHSVAGRLAAELGVRNADRNVFLDNTLEKDYIKGQIAELVAIAKKHGSAIAIGHPHPQTIEAIKESLESLNGSVEIVGLSEIVDKNGPEHR